MTKKVKIRKRPDVIVTKHSVKVHGHKIKDWDICYVEKEHYTYKFNDPDRSVDPFVRNVPYEYTLYLSIIDPVDGRESPVGPYAFGWGSNGDGAEQAEKAIKKFLSENVIWKTIYKTKEERCGRGKKTVTKEYVPVGFNDPEDQRQYEEWWKPNGRVTGIYVDSKGDGK